MLHNALQQKMILKNGAKCEVNSKSWIEESEKLKGYASVRLLFT